MFEIGNWDKKNYLELLRMIDRKTGIACFDFDNTLVKNDFGELVMNEIIFSGLPKLNSGFEIYFRDKELAKKIFKSRFDDPKKFSNFINEEYLQIQNLFDVETSYRWSSFIFSGYTKEELRNFSREIWNKEKSKPNSKDKVQIFQDMFNLIQYLKEKSWQVYIVTASPEEIIREIANEFGVIEKNVIGMNLVEQNGMLTDKILEPYTYGLGKVISFRSRTGKTPDLCFGDSMNDFELLSSAKLNGIALDKGNKDFISKSTEKKFLIQKHFI